MRSTSLGLFKVVLFLLPHYVSLNRVEKSHLHIPTKKKFWNDCIPLLNERNSSHTCLWLKESILKIKVLIEILWVWISLHPQSHEFSVALLRDKNESRSTRLEKHVYTNTPLCECCGFQKTCKGRGGKGSFGNKAQGFQS